MDTPPVTLHSTRTNPSDEKDSHTVDETDVQLVVCWAFPKMLIRNKKRSPRNFLRLFTNREYLNGLPLQLKVYNVENDKIKGNNGVEELYVVYSCGIDV